MTKKLYAAIDFSDDIMRNGLYEKQHLDHVFDALADIGVTRVDWLYSPFGTFGDDYPGGFNPARYAVEAGHARGMTMCFVFKPYETGIGEALPPTFPRPGGVPWIDDIRGILYRVSPFVAANPHLRMRRIPGAWSVGGPIRTIKLVKQNPAPTRVRKEHLSIWTSDRQNGFTCYEGDFTLTDAVEHKLIFPRSRDFRVLTLSGLDIPEDRRFIVVKCSLADDNGDFTNETVNLVELYNAEGTLVPSTPGSAPPDENYIRRCETLLPWTAYGRHPEVEALLADPAAVRRHFEDFYGFDVFSHNTELMRGMPHALDGAGFAAVARGKAAHLPGAMHPSHPEVRAHWMDEVRRFVEYGFDVVSFRESNHSSTSHEREEYGFNAPALEACRCELDIDCVARVSGEYYTDFLRSAASRIRAAGRRVEAHLFGNYIGLYGQRAGGPTVTGPFIDYKWKIWAREIADGVQVRTASSYRPTTLRMIVDRFTRVAKNAGNKEVVLQVRMKSPESEYAQEFARWNFDFVKSHPRIDALLLYETANFTSRAEDGAIVLSPALVELVKRDFWERA